MLVRFLKPISLVLPLSVPVTKSVNTPMTPKHHLLQAVNQAPGNKSITPMGVALPQPVGVAAGSGLASGIVVQPPSHLLAKPQQPGQPLQPLQPLPSPAPAGVKLSPPLSLVQPPKAHAIHGAQQPFPGAVASPPLHKAPVIASASSFRAATVPKPPVSSDSLVTGHTWLGKEGSQQISRYLHRTDPSCYG